MEFLKIVGFIGSMASISGVSLKNLIPFVSDPDKKLLNEYFNFLEGKQVLVTPFDNEVPQAVIKSLESIKECTEQLRVKVNCEYVKHLLLDLVHTLSKELMGLHKYEDSNNEVFFFKVLQIIRVKFARASSLLCAAYEIDLSLRHSNFASLVLEHAYKVR